MASYTAKNIQKLEGLNAVKQRLGMYAGNTDTPNQVALEIVSNSIDEIAQGYGNVVYITIDVDGHLIVEDRGRGIPFDIHPKYKTHTLDIVLTELHTGGKMDNTTDESSYKTSIGLNGCGVKLASATCEKMYVDVWRDNQHAHREIRDGKLIGDIKVVKDTTTPHTGTRIEYWPLNDGTWASNKFDVSKLKTVIRDFSYFFPMATFIMTIKGKKKDEVHTYHATDGLLDMYNKFTENDDLMFKEPIRLKRELDGISDGLEIIFGFTNGSMERVHSYCNALKLAEGGTHVQGFRTALTKALNDAGRNLDVIKAKDANLKGQEIFESIVSIISVKLKEPKFENQTKTKLSNPDLAGKVNSIVYEYLKNYFEDNPKVVITLIDRILRMRYAKEKARKAKELALSEGKKNEFSTTLIGKLSHCSGKDPMKNELIIIEGLSAGGNIKQARDSKTQAVYALKGKVLNVEKADITKIAENQEIRDLINILGTGIGDDFNISKLKYGKIIIATDADVDGSHISVLLLTFLFKFMPELIKHGHVYSAVGPLYKIMYNNQSHYAMDDKERNEIINKIKNKYKYSVTRYKGLGELDAKDLRDTMVDPDKRTLIQYEIEDMASVTEMFVRLMGVDATNRKTFLEGEV